MILKEYICVKCKRRFHVEILEDGEPLPPGTVPTKPQCVCGSFALIDPTEVIEKQDY